MGHRRTNHRPLRAGIGVTPNLGIPGYGTLTGIARRANGEGPIPSPPPTLAPNASPLQPLPPTLADPNRLTPTPSDPKVTHSV